MGPAAGATHSQAQPKQHFLLVFISYISSRQYIKVTDVSSSMDLSLKGHREGFDIQEEPTVGELVEVAKREDVQRATAAFVGPFQTNRAPESVAKRSKKSRPREISSKRPVPVGRERCLGIDDGRHRGRSVRKGFDPRFEEHCGDLREQHVERNYAFMDGIRERRRSVLEKSLKRENGDESAAMELRQMQEEDGRKRNIMRRREILREVREEEKEAVKRGKQPYFLKEKDIRKLEVKAKFKELKKIGGVKKYIEKRRRRLASKDRKLLPERR